MSDEVVATGIGPSASMDWPRVACLVADDFELLAPDLGGLYSPPRNPHGVRGLSELSEDCPRTPLGLN